jgi:hypothetical protein
MHSTWLRSCRRGAVAMLLCLTLLPAAASAQQWDVAAMVGVGVPFGDLADFTNPGFSASLSTTRWMSPRWGIRVGGAGNFLGSEFDDGPSAKLWHYNGGIEVDIVPASSTFAWHANAGLGGTTSDFGGDETATDFTINLGTTFEYPLNDYVRIIGGPSFYFIMAEETQTVMPITAGIRYFFSTN